jgi:hypothetical protein
MHPNERLLWQIYEAPARRDDQSLRDVFSEGIIWHVPGRNAISARTAARIE